MICDGKARIDIRRLRCGDTDAITVCGITLPVVRTPCHFGGTRHWFLCRQCERRCVLLYEDGYLCRICVNGRYRSELASPRKRQLLKSFKTRDRLGQTGWEGLLAPFPGKPKHMHWSTYLKIRAAAEQHELGFLQDELAKLKKSRNP
ncbi:hypothetical protein [uncultured Paracoccus sp.]|uniref:hypothetical protein n=1 Tax=uncultured Paracoccus sp. TaxID=189685 RepID=UPI0026352774|nr:hypothetical protein [uncultured Paracoccus sp.]